MQKVLKREKMADLVSKGVEGGEGGKEISANQQKLGDASLLEEGHEGISSQEDISGKHNSVLGIKDDAASGEDQYESESDDSVGLGRRRRGEASDDEDGEDKEDQDEGREAPILSSDNEDDVLPEDEDDGRSTDFIRRRRKREEDVVEGEGGVEDYEELNEEAVEGEGKAEEEGDDNLPKGSISREPEDGEIVDVNGVEVTDADGGGEDNKENGEEKEEQKPPEPFVVPTSGAFYMHDDRFSESGGSRPRGGGRGGRKLWESRNDKPWVHDMFEELNLRDDEGLIQKNNEDYQGGRRGGRGRQGEDRANPSLWDAAFSKPGRRGGRGGPGGPGGRGQGRMRAFRDDDNDPLQSNHEETSGEELSTVPLPLPGTGEYLAPNAGRGRGRSYLKATAVQNPTLNFPQIDKGVLNPPPHSGGRYGGDLGRGGHGGRHPYAGRGNQGRGGGRGGFAGFGEGGRGHQGGVRGGRRGRGGRAGGFDVSGSGGRGSFLDRIEARVTVDGRGVQPGGDIQQGATNTLDSSGASDSPAVEGPSESNNTEPSPNTTSQNTPPTERDLQSTESSSSQKLNPNDRKRQVSGDQRSGSTLTPTRQGQGIGTQQALREGSGGASVSSGSTWNAAGSGILYGPGGPGGGTGGPGGSNYRVPGGSPFVYGASGMRVNAPDFSPQGNAVALQYGGQGGAMGVPNVDIGMGGYGSPGAPQYAYTAPEVTWVPVIASGGGPLGGGYGSPYISMEAPPPPVFYGAPGQQPAFGPPAGDGSGKGHGGLWKPPPMQDLGGDQFGQRQSKPRRYSEMSFGQ